MKHLTKYPVYRNCYIDKLQFGESKQNVLERLLPYYENDILYTLSENKFPLIVTHKHCARVLMKHLLKISDADFRHYKLPEKKILLVGLKENLEYDKHFEFEY
jgi:bisphosphoglycerate-dependent phosphoglycerate mutase